MLKKRSDLIEYFKISNSFDKVGFLEKLYLTQSNDIISLNQKTT